MDQAITVGELLRAAAVVGGIVVFVMVAVWLLDKIDLSH